MEEKANPRPEWPGAHTTSKGEEHKVRSDKHPKLDLADFSLPGIITKDMDKRQKQKRADDSQKPRDPNDTRYTP